MHALPLDVGDPDPETRSNFEFDPAQGFSARHSTTVAIYKMHVDSGRAVHVLCGLLVQPAYSPPPHGSAELLPVCRFYLYKGHQKGRRRRRECVSLSMPPSRLHLPQTRREEDQLSAYFYAVQMITLLGAIRLSEGLAGLVDLPHSALSSCLLYIILSIIGVSLLHRALCREKLGVIEYSFES